MVHLLVGMNLVSICTSCIQIYIMCDSANGCIIRHDSSYRKIRAEKIIDLNAHMD